MDSATKSPGDLNGKKLCPKIILEGTRLTLKTEIAYALNEHPSIVGPRKYKYHSPIISAEWCAFTNFPWGRGLINFNREEEEQAMETYRTWIKLFELQKYYSWIIDRFHLSTKLYQRKYKNREYDFRWLENRLDKLGFHLVLCTRNTESFIEARKERIKISGNPGQYDDLKLFADEQSELKKLFKESVLMKIELDVSNNDVNGVVEKIADWMTQTGGLYAK